MDQFNLKRYIRNKQADDKTLLTRLAKVAGFANTSTLSKWLDKPEKELENFSSLIAIVKELFPNDEAKVMAAYSKTLDVNKKTSRIMLEWLTVNRMVEGFKELLERMFKASNKESLEFAAIYKIILPWQTHFTDVNNLKQLDDIRTIKVHLSELCIFQKILESYSYYYCYDYKMVSTLLEGLEDKINQIKDEFLRTSYLTRIYEMLSYVSLKVLNHPDKAREYAYKVINFNIGKRFVAYSFFIIGFSYFFESYDKSKHNLAKSIELYGEIDYEVSVNEMIDNMEMLNAFWGIETTFKFKQNEAYYKAKNGEEIPDNVPYNEEAYRLLVQGVYKKDVNTLIESMIEWLSEGDTFFAQICKIELAKLGYNENFINKLLMINDF